MACAPRLSTRSTRNCWHLSRPDNVNSICRRPPARSPFIRGSTPGEPFVGVSPRDFPEYHRNLNRIFAPSGVKPRIAVECDTTSSGLIEVEAGHGIALCIPILKLVTGKRLLYRPVSGTTESVSIGIARATKGDVTPVGESFARSCGRLRMQPLRSKQNREGLLKPAAHVMPER